MPALHSRERETTDYREQASGDREISLGTGTILAIFFALALVCAVFFGLGYSMGRKSAAQAAAVAAASPEPAPSDTTFSGFKPAAGHSASPAATAKRATEDAAPPSDPDATIVTTPVASSDSDTHTSASRTAPRKEAVPPASPAATAHDAPRAAAPMIDPNGTSIVQVAAVSHQEDADVLLSALKKRGYAVFIRQEPQDHLLHVQVGPFANKKDAETMRQRLLADGYNAIVK